MGEIIENKSFTLNADGTISRNEKCPNCGKEVYSKGDYCEHCGHKIHLEQAKDYEKKGAIWQFILLGVATVFVGVGGIVLGFLLQRVIPDANNVLHYKYEKKTRVVGMIMVALSVVSSIIWLAAQSA